MLGLLIALLAADAQAALARPKGIQVPIALNPEAGLYRVERAFESIAFKDLDKKNGNPVFLTAAPEKANRLFIVEQRGKIRHFPNDPKAKQSQVQVFADLTGTIRYDYQPGAETGLLGFAFAPDFAATGFLYVAYTTQGLGLQVARLTATDTNGDQVFDSAPASSLKPIILVPKRPQLVAANHNGGMIAFGPDGMLYIGTGDGGSGGDPLGSAQNVCYLLGKILRIDPQHAPAGKPYAIPSDNPVLKGVDDQGKACEENRIWAYGIRNPWRFSFDRGTGELWLGDVGQGAWEEIDIVERGGNYGWNLREGNHAYNGGKEPPFHKKPVHEYSHADGVSITGGYRYRGKALPDLYGSYIYGDYASGRIWSLATNNGVTTSNTELAVLPDGMLSSFGEDRDGELYLLQVTSGEIYRIVANENPGVDPEMPELLSQTGIFKGDVTKLEPVAGILEYEVNSPLWSDGALKRRWIVMPPKGPKGNIEFQESSPWSLPIGTILVKHFELAGGIKLETRLLVHHQRGSGDEWVGYTYRWRTLNGKTDAQLLKAGETGVYNGQTWTFPSQRDCLSCHTAGMGSALSTRTEQLNRGGQLAQWKEAGFFEKMESDPALLPAYPDPADTSLGAADRARSYLAVNCAHCHSPSGTAPGGIDFRFDIPLKDMNLVGVQAIEGFAGLRVSPGNKEDSVLWLRLISGDAEIRMPPLATSIVDPVGKAAIGQWIDQL